MKKMIAIALALMLMMSIVGCGASATIPSLDEIKTQYYTDDELERALNRVKRDALIDAWGEPTGTISHENEDVWVLDGTRALVISYHLNGTVDDVDIED